MPGQASIERLVQRIGARISLRVFSDERLDTAWGERAYLFLYETFKRLFERTELRNMARFIERGTTVVDVGANVGFMTLFFSKRVGDEGAVLAIEPDPIMARLLARNVARRGRTNVTVLPIAIGHEEGRKILYRNLSNRADNRMSPDESVVPRRREVEVPVRNLSNVLAEHAELPRVSLVKIDTQGHEVAVLDGMRDWLRSRLARPVLAVECWPYGLRVADTSIDKLFERLSDLGYAVPAEHARRFLPDAGPDLYDSVLFFPAARRPL